MRSGRFVTVCILLLVSCCVSTPLLAATIDDLEWLKGCWVSEDKERQTTEHWLKPEGRTMLGVSRTIAGGKTVEFEFLRIVQEANGDLYFVALPSGQKEARFKLIKLSAREAVFENPVHDFPQRVIYRLENENSLLGRIEGRSNGREKAVDFPLQRIRCDD